MHVWYTFSVVCSVVVLLDQIQLMRIPKCVATLTLHSHVFNLLSSMEFRHDENFFTGSSNSPLVMILILEPHGS